MRFVLTLLLAALCFCGCFSGRIVEGIPRLQHPLPKKTTKIFLSRPYKGDGRPLQGRSVKLVTDAFGAALKEKGVEYVLPDKRTEKLEDAFKAAVAAKCGIVLSVEVNFWGYNDAGFSGFRERDEVELSVVVADSYMKRIIARTRLYSEGSFEKIIKRYVDSLVE